MEPVQNMSPPECVNFGCKMGHGVKVNIYELLSLEQYTTMTDASKSNAVNYGSEITLHENPSALDKGTHIFFYRSSSYSFRLLHRWWITDLIDLGEPEENIGHSDNVDRQEPMDTTPAPDADFTNERLDRIGTPIDTVCDQEDKPVTYSETNGIDEKSHHDSVDLPPLETIIVKLDEVEPIFGTIRHHLNFKGEDYVGIAFVSNFN